MKPEIFKPHLSAAIGLVLMAPATYFIFISVLKYVFGLPFLFDAAAPLLEGWGIRNAMGWNINFLILFGPPAAFLLNLAFTLQIYCQVRGAGINIPWCFQKKVGNPRAIAISGLCLIVLFMYAMGENSNGPSTAYYVTSPWFLTGLVLL